MRTTARVSAELLLILAMLAVALWVLGRMWPIVWPLIVGLLLTTLTWPAARFLRRHGWPPALAAAVVTVAFLLAVTGIVALIAVPMSSQTDELTDGVLEGIERLREWAAGPPLNIDDAQVTGALDSAMARIQDSVGSMVTAVASGVGTVVNGVVTAVLGVFLMFFFLKDGPRFLPSPCAAGRRLAPSSARRRSSDCSTRSSSASGCGSWTCPWCCRWRC